MDAHTFDLTPAQKDLLIALAAATGKPIPALLAEALAGLQDQVQARNGAPPPLPTDHGVPPRPQHLGAIAADMLTVGQSTDLAQLPVDVRDEHDHYIKD